MSNASKRIKATLDILEKMLKEDDFPIETLENLLLDRELNKKIHSSSAYKKRFIHIYDAVLNNIVKMRTNTTRRLFTSIPEDQFYYGFDRNLSLDPALWSSYQNYLISFGQMAFHVENSVLKACSDEERAIVLERWLHLWKKFYDVRNYHDALAIYTGLNTRIMQKITRHGLSKQAKAILDELNNFTDRYTGKKTIIDGKESLVSKPFWRVVEAQESEGSLPCIPYINVYDNNIEVSSMTGRANFPSDANELQNFKATEEWKSLSPQQRALCEKLPGASKEVRELTIRKIDSFTKNIIDKLKTIQERNAPFVSKLESQHHYPLNSTLKDLTEIFQKIKKQDPIGLLDSLEERRHLMDEGVMNRYLGNTLTYDDLTWWIYSYQYRGRKPSFTETADFETPANSLLSTMISKYPLQPLDIKQAKVASSLAFLTSPRRLTFSSVEEPKIIRKDTITTLFDSVNHDTEDKGKEKDISELSLEEVAERLQKASLHEQTHSDNPIILENGEAGLDGSEMIVVSNSKTNILLPKLNLTPGGSRVVADESVVDELKVPTDSGTPTSQSSQSSFQVQELQPRSIFTPRTKNLALQIKMKIEQLAENSDLHSSSDSNASLSSRTLRENPLEVIKKRPMSVRSMATVWGSQPNSNPSSVPNTPGRMLSPRNPQSVSSTRTDRLLRKKSISEKVIVVPRFAEVGTQSPKLESGFETDLMSRFSDDDYRSYKEENFFTGLDVINELSSEKQVSDEFASLQQLSDKLPENNQADLTEIKELSQEVEQSHSLHQRPEVPRLGLAANGEPSSSLTGVAYRQMTPRKQVELIDRSLRTPLSKRSPRPEQFFHVGTNTTNKDLERKGNLLTRAVSKVLKTEKSPSKENKEETTGQHSHRSPRLFGLFSGGGTSPRDEASVHTPRNPNTIRKGSKA